MCQPNSSMPQGSERLGLKNVQPVYDLDPSDLVDLFCRDMQNSRSIIRLHHGIMLLVCALISIY